MTNTPNLSSKRRTVRRIIVVISIILTLIFIKLLVSFVTNEIFIGQYTKGNYDAGILSANKLANFPESYVLPYNTGNANYRKSNFTAAVSEYQKALESAPKDKICDVRLNLGLAMTALVDANASAKTVREQLEAVLLVLAEDGCANNTSSGSHSGAQTLYDEIVAYLEQTSEESESESDESDEDGEEGESEEAEESESDSEAEAELEQKIRAQAEKSAYERDRYNSSEDYQYYDGKNW